MLLLLKEPAFHTRTQANRQKKQTLFCHHHSSLHPVENSTTAHLFSWGVSNGLCEQLVLQNKQFAKMAFLKTECGSTCKNVQQTSTHSHFEIPPQALYYFVCTSHFEGPLLCVPSSQSLFQFL